MNTHVKILDVTPRDGLQNLKKFVPTEKKIQLIQMLYRAGCHAIEITSSVRVDQMRDAFEICSAFAGLEDIDGYCLVPTLKAVERVAESGIKSLAVVMSASEVHNKANVNRTVQKSLEEIRSIAAFSKSHGLKLRGCIGTAFGYELDSEPVTAEKVLNIARVMVDAGYSEITISDTTGIANPKSVYELCSMVLDEVSPVIVHVHFHQNNGIELANCLAALNAGVRVFEVAVGGLGGCPFAPNAGANTNTEVLVEMFEKMNISTGVDNERVKECSEFSRGLQRDYYEQD